MFGVSERERVCVRDYELETALEKVSDERHLVLLDRFL